MPSVRPLSKELRTIAENELNEDPNRMEEDIKYMKEWIEKEPHLITRNDDQFIVTLLRFCKYSLEKAKFRLDAYYSIRGVLPEIYHNRDPMLPEMQKIMESGFCLPLLKTISPDAPRIILIRPALVSTSWSINDLAKFVTMMVDVLITEDDVISIAGHRILEDLKGYSMDHFKIFNPTNTAHLLMAVQKNGVVRQKGIHVINAPGFFEMIYKLFSPLLIDKIKKRIVIHPSDNLTEFHKIFPSEVLPKEYGGSGESIDELIIYWKNKIESYRDFFKDDAKYGVDESKRINKSDGLDNGFGADGSFRKLNID